MAIDFLEKEVKRLQERFDATLGQAKTASIRVRTLALLTICRAHIIAISVRKTSNDQIIRKMTEEFRGIREVMNGLFDRIESERERRLHEYDKDKHSAVGR